MEEMACLWSYQENVDDLKQKLMCTTLELEQLKMQSAEENRRNREYIKQLLQLVELACKERDEARDQLQKLLNKIMPSADFRHDFIAGLSPIQPDSPIIKATAKSNSSITESNSLSDTHNYHSHSSSAGDSFFDAVSSPEFTNVNVCGDSSNIVFANQPLVHGCEGIMGNNIFPSGIPVIDQASLVIDSILQGKTLPQKGKLLKAVLDAGPLLQNLLVAGPLPRWRNPPMLSPTFEIPPVSMKGCDVEVRNGKFAPNLSPVASRSMSSRPYAEMLCSSQTFSNCVLNFGNGANGSCLGGERLIAPGTNANSFVPLGKRQRLY